MPENVMFRNLKFAGWTHNVGCTKRWTGDGEAGIVARADAASARSECMEIMPCWQDSYICHTTLWHVLGGTRQGLLRNLERKIVASHPQKIGENTQENST